MEDKQIIDISKIKVVKSDTEVPVYDNLFQTKRSLCASFPENAIILDKIDNVVKVITDLSADIKEDNNCINNLPNHVEELQAVFDPNNVIECDVDLFKDKDYQQIENIKDLKKYLSELIIRFDTRPKNYTKEDYQILLYILKGALLYLYEVSEAKIKVNSVEIPRQDNIYQINVSGDEHINVLDSDTGVQLAINVGEMETPSTKLATINDIRNYIENRLAWQVINN